MLLKRAPDPPRPALVAISECQIDGTPPVGDTIGAPPPDFLTYDGEPIPPSVDEMKENFLLQALCAECTFPAGGELCELRK